jgi:uncharacterized protein with PQ loop repeat
MSQTVKKSILSKLFWTVLAFSVFYMISLSLGFCPQYMKDIVSWFANNVYLFSFMVCFLAVLWVIYKIKTHRRGDYE